MTEDEKAERKYVRDEELERKKIRAVMFTRVAVVIVVFLLGILLFITVLASIKTEQTAAQNQELSKQVLQTQKILVDCTRPRGQCYKEGQERTAQAVNGINRGTMEIIGAAFACEDQGVVGKLRMIRCIHRQLRN